MTEGVAKEVRLLAGRYQVGDLIGRGGMADVHSGTDTRLGRRVAIKLLKPALATDPAFRTRFRREAQDAAKMAHPTIVRVFDAGEETITDSEGMETQLPFIVMEFVDGRLLKDIIAEGPIEPTEAVRIAAQILTALEYSHRAGVIHRDIKPGNIMITSQGQVKVMDFGIARAVSESSATLAETSAIVGTAQYFSPEQARGEAVDARTDLYSTGVVLFEMLTGKAPFRGENPVAVAYQHVNQNPVPPSKLNPAVSPALDAVVLRALSKDRFTRFQSAAEFRQDLEAAAKGAVTVKKQPQAKGFETTLFGVNPEVTAGSDATFRQLSVDADARVARTQNRPPVAWIFAGVVVMLAVIFGVGYWALHLTVAPLPTSSVTVPDVSSQSYDDGATKLEDNKLVPREVTETSESVAEGDIIRTSPEAGIKTSPKQVVTVYVSSGRPSVTIPSVTGMSQKNAEKELKAKKLVVGEVSKETSASVKKGVVIRTTPTGGFEGQAGDLIDLVISTGKVKVPSVVGQSATDAGNALAALKLNVIVQPNYGCSGGAVTSQSLQPGNHDQGSTITIGVCTG